MSNDSVPESTFGLDQHGRLYLNVRTFHDTLRRIDSNSRPDDLAHNSTLGDTSRDSISDLTDHEPSSDMTDIASSPNQTISSIPLSSDEDKRYCWVCFATDEDDATAPWVKPCHCRGTAKWVHQRCIQRWVDEKQKGRAGAHVACPQCNTEYIIVYPNLGPLVVILDKIDGLIYRVCPVITAGILMSCMYWTAVTYGAVTVMQVIGHKDGLYILEQGDPMVLLVGLPTIPIMLILGKMLDWEDQVLRLFRRHAWKFPLLKRFLTYRFTDEDIVRSQDVPSIADPASATRIFCGALLLPTIATICGRIFFYSINSNFQRTLLGGAAFITIKGAFKIYYKQQQYIRQRQRRIMDYTENNLELYRRQ